MFRRFVRHLKEGYLGFKRHLGMSISSASAVTITLLLVGIFLVITYNLQIATRNIEDSISISALVAYGKDDKENLKRIEKEIRQIEGIASIQYLSKEQEFNYYINNNSDQELKEFYSHYRSENPFHDAFILKLISPKNLEQVKGSLNKIKDLDGVYDGGKNTYTLVTILANIRLVGGCLVLALCLLAIYLIYNTIKITIESRKNEIWIMRNVGAKNGYIRAPFLVEGILIGFIGSILPICSVAGSYYYLFTKVEGNLFGAIFLVEPLPFVFIVGAILLAIAIFVGFMGSYLSVCKFLRLRR